MSTDHPLPSMVSAPTGMTNLCRQKGERPMETRITQRLQQISTIQNPTTRFNKGGGGDSDPSDLVVKKRRKRKRKEKNKGEMATPPRSDHCWSRSPSPKGEGRRRGPKAVLKRVVGFRRVGMWFSLEVSQGLI